MGKIFGYIVPVLVWLRGLITVKRGLNFADIVAVYEDRIPPERRDPDLFYYSMRHGDMDWSMPATIESAVCVNFWGTLVTKKPLPSEKGVVLIDLTDEEGTELMWLADADRDSQVGW